MDSGFRRNDENASYVDTKAHTSVVPAKAGTHFDLRRKAKWDSGFRRNDENASYVDTKGPHLRRPGEGRDPFDLRPKAKWIPAFAGMTVRESFRGAQCGAAVQNR